jgi:YesN/AraC family two-component response regulator
MPNAVSPRRSSIVIVDDEPTVREAVACGLADLYTMRTAASGTEALSILRTHSVALIILDAVLQDENGLDYVARFRQLSPAPILLLTGHGSEELASRACWAGLKGYLKKPVDLHNLRATIQRLVPPADHRVALAVRTRQYLDEHLAEAYSAGRVARAVGASERQVRRCFLVAYGKTPHQYVAARRLEHATILLRTTWFGIEEIARRVGHPDGVWFTKCFTRAYGMAPSMYRAHHRVPSATC